MQRHAIMWFRNDLRIHDNEALFDAVQSGYHIIPIYVFDSRLFGGQSRHGLPKISGQRTQFLLECVMALRASLRSMGGDLLVRVGIPEDEIYKVARIAKSSAVFCNRERTSEEIAVQDALERKLWSIGQEIRYFRGKMLYYTQDLPFPVLHTPDSLKSFRLEVERFVKVRAPLAFNKKAVCFSKLNLDEGQIPTVSDLLPSNPSFMPSIYKGGEKNGLLVLEALMKNYHAKKNNELNYSGIAPYLSVGCLSPKTVYYKALEKFKVIEGKLTKNKLIEDLIIRDFYRMLGKKYKNKIFTRGGVVENIMQYDIDNISFQNWMNGNTADELVNSIMINLKNNGFIANLDRQLVALYLVEVLSLNWQLGAEYFESVLIDYDPCSNWLNWNWIAGLTKDNKTIQFVSTKKKRLALMEMKTVK